MPEMETIVKVIESAILADICLSRITELLRFTSFHFELLNVKTALNVSKKAFKVAGATFVMILQTVRARSV